jgi:hypothetical protein
LNDQPPLTKRREKIFGTAVLLAGLSIIGLCVMPYVLADTAPLPIFPTVQQEKFFFDVFGMIFACWLLSWVAALNEWFGVARSAQWLGIILLSSDQAVLVNVWRDVANQVQIQVPIGLWLAPLMLQTYLVGCFLGFFTLPGLTRAGNRTLTGLATLLILLPWLVASDLVRVGAEYLHGLVF